MNASQLRTKVPLVSPGTEPDHETDEDQETTTDDQSGSLRRKLALGVGFLGAAMYARRRRSRNVESEPDTITDEDESTTGPDPEQHSKRRGGIGRRLKILAVSALVFAIARSVVRRVRS